MHPTPEQIRQALPHIRYEIESFLQTPAHDFHNEALQESVYFRKMAHCRALYHFFRKPLSERQDRRKRVDDDVLSEDYGFQAKDVYGEDSATLLNRFNKDLLHLTYARLDRTPETKPWPMDELFLPLSGARESSSSISCLLTRTELPRRNRRGGASLETTLASKFRFSKAHPT